MEERLKKMKAPACAASLFAGWNETLIWSALEGWMGSIWTVADAPEAAICETGDFLFLAGRADHPETRLLLECWRKERGMFEILVPRDAACGLLAEQIFGAGVRAGKRCAFLKGGECFDEKALRGMIKAVPAGISIVPLDRSLHELALKNSWSRDFVSQFSGAEDYLRRGVGFAAVYKDELVGGASSYTRYSEGIEIQVETRSDWQRRGIASACCAALILECLRRGLYPSWDAANPASAALAGKLGYCEAGLYPVWYRAC